MATNRRETGDVMRHYPVNLSRVEANGSSMGGYGSWRMSAGYPDMFAAVAHLYEHMAANMSWEA